MISRTAITSSIKSTVRRRSRSILSSPTNVAFRNTDRASSSILPRYFSTEEEEERDSMAYDVLIVGGGPAGLAASIRLKQLCLDLDRDVSVCVVEKGSEIGAHILSGNVFDSKALEELLPSDDWIESLAASTGSVATPVTEDSFLMLSETNSYEIPNVLLPSQLHNDGNYVISLSQVCRYLSEVAEELGVEIYAGFAADGVLYQKDEKGVTGIQTKDAGIDKDGNKTDLYEAGVNILARQTLFAEGARGNCAESIISKLNLQESNSQTYALGIKEVWQIPEENHKPGFVQHTLGWPLQHKWNDKNFGGSFLYHQSPNLVHAGFVVGLDYENPYLNPYKEFQRWKTHQSIKPHLEGGDCISYGARVLNEGGYHSLPKLTFKGGMLLGCSAGFLNSVKIKGSHCAIKSGIEAAECVFDSVKDATEDTEEFLLEQCDKEEYQAEEIKQYGINMKTNWVGQELYQVRNCHSAFHKWGFLPGLIYTGLCTYVTKGREPWTLSHHNTDAQMTQPADSFEEIAYPLPDGIISFDLLTNLQRSGTNHQENQPAHLRIKNGFEDIPENVSFQKYAAPEQRFCPANVYEYVGEEGQDQKLVINAQNCVHCKCCSIKMPHEYINWTVPEGGGGPQYQVM